jgi:hypothetical protein
VENEKIHLVSSIIFVKEINFKDYIKHVNRIDNNKKHYLFIIIPYGVKMKMEVIDNLTIYIITLDEFIEDYKNKENQLFTELFGSLELKSKLLDSVYQESLFVFCNMDWHNIVLKFKIEDVNLSGGSISGRHILDSVSYQLSNNLNYLFDYNSEFIKNLLYNNKKQPNLKNEISLEFYKKYQSYKEKQLLDLKYQDIENLQIKDSTELDIDEKFKMLKHNLYLSFNLLVDNIKKNLNLERKILNNSLISLIKERDFTSYNLDKIENINDVNTRGMSNKAKKTFKKERTAVNNKDPNILKEHEKNKENLQSLQSQIKNLEEKINKREIELQKIEGELKNKTFAELEAINKENSKIENKNKKLAKYLPFIKKNNKFNTNYSTYL